jgi:hypothetical protein
VRREEKHDASQEDCCLQEWKNVHHVTTLPMPKLNFTQNASVGHVYKSCVNFETKPWSSFELPRLTGIIHFSGNWTARWEVPIEAIRGLFRKRCEESLYRLNQMRSKNAADICRKTISSDSDFE